MLKRMIANKKRKGFTLVEMLIVIIIIGILAGTLLLTMGAGTGKAEAAKIVSNLRTLKGACLFYYSDNNNWPDSSMELDSDSFARYLGGQNFVGYTFSGAKGESLFVGITGLDTSPEIKEALAKMASNVALCGGAKDAVKSKDVYTNQNAAWLLVR